jgi:hypothetical protein
VHTVFQGLAHGQGVVDSHECTVLLDLPDRSRSRLDVGTGDTKDVASIAACI